MAISTQRGNDRLLSMRSDGTCRVDQRQTQPDRADIGGRTLQRKRALRCGGQHFLDRQLDRLPQVSGADEADTFATMQRIDRDIWLLNGGAGNRQGTLP